MLSEQELTATENYQSHKREQYSRKQFGDKYIT